MKKLVKLAVIRSDTEARCPFGLSIPDGCSKVGPAIRQMAPLDTLGEDASDEEKAEITAANNDVFMWLASGERCPYAAKLFEDKDVVECSWAAEEGEGSPVGSPFYYKHFSGIGLDGLYSYPTGYYTDNSIDRGMYYGMYSIESTGEKNIEHIKKEADGTKEK
jgi:hypothetical protein